MPVTGGDPELVVRDAAFPIPLDDGSIAVVTGLRGLFGEQTPTVSIVDDRGEISELVTAESSVWQPRVSPDGTRLAFVEGDSVREGGRVRVVDIATGRHQVVGRGEVVDWRDDETLIVAANSP